MSEPTPHPVNPMRLVLLAATAAAFAASAARADEPKPIWDLKLGVSYVATSGNSDTSTAGATFDFNRRFDLWSLKAYASAVRAAKDGTTSAERYLAGARADYPVSGRLGLTAGVRGERDRFAGFDLRSIIDGGVSYKLITDELWTVNTIGALTWTHEDRVAQPTADAVGGLAGIDAKVKLSASSSAAATLSFYPSFKDGADWRIESQLGLQAALNGWLSLRVGYELRYANTPVPGFKKTDTVTLASLVMSKASSITR